MKHEGDMTGGEVRDQMRTVRQGKKRVEKEKVQWHGPRNYAIFR